MAKDKFITGKEYRMGDLAEKKAMSRIDQIADPGSFVEIGGLVQARSTDFNLKNFDTASDGVITGYCVVDGCPVYIFSQDASVLGGTIGEMHSKKICNLYEMAVKTATPIVGLLDCAGLRLQEATDALNAFGTIYAKQSQASGIVPQVMAVFGSCGGGLSLIPAMADFTFMEDKAKLFVNSPNTLAGNREDKLATWSAKYQSEVTGNVHFTGSEAEIFAGIRGLLSVLPTNNQYDLSDNVCTDDLNRVCAELTGCVEDTSLALKILSDSNVYVEVRENYAPEMITAFIKLNGATVGAVANRTQKYGADMEVTFECEPYLTADGVKKAAEFIKFCDAFNIPVLTLTNVEGFKADIDEEITASKATAGLVYALSSATVPKVNVIIGNAFGTAYIAMNSKAVGADLTFAWDNSKIGTMEPKNAVMIMYAEEIKNAEDKNALIAEKTEEYTKNQSSAMSAARRGYVDAVIAAADTRKHVIAAFEMLYSKSEDNFYKKHGTV